MSSVAHMACAASAIADRASLAAAKLALVGMVCVIGVQVVARYGLHSPPGWTEELARYLMVWGGLLGATAAFRRAVDPAVVAPDESGIGLASLFSRVAIAATVLIFVLPILYYSFFGPHMDPTRSFLMRNLARTSSGLGLNLIFVAAAIPAFCIVTLIHLAARLIAGPAAKQGPSHDSDIG